MPTLVYCDVDGVEHTYELGAQPVTIGRSVECTIRSDDPRMSRQHARLSWGDGGVWIEDLGSANGVYVGLERVQRAPVPPGEVVVVGSIVFQLAIAGSTLPPPMGVHGTLAQWLSLERKARRALTEERDAFATRVGEIHAERTHALEVAQVEVERAQARASEAEAARRVLSDALEEGRRELERVRARDAAVQRAHAATVEALRAELEQAKDDRVRAEAQVGVVEAAARAQAERERVALVEQLAATERRSEDALAQAIGERDDARRRLVAAETAAAAVAVQAQGSARAQAEVAHPSGETSMASPAFKTIRMAPDETPAADTQALLRQIVDLTRRAEAAETTAKALGGDVAAALRRATEAEGRAAALDQAVAAATARTAAAERRADNAARAAAADIAQARKPAADGERETTDSDGVFAAETTASAAVAVDAHAEVARRLAEAEDEARRLGEEVRTLQSQLREVRAPAAPRGATPDPARLDELEEAIDSVRANLRAAADEVAALPAATVAAEALAQAQDDLRRAREATAAVVAWARGDAALDPHQ